VVEGLGAAFLAAWGGSAPGDDLDAELAAACRDAVAEYGASFVEDVEFCSWLGQRAGEAATAVAALRALRSSDLYLACACARGVPAALRTFDERLLARLGRHLARLRLPPEGVEEVRIALRERLLLPAPDGPPRIAQFSGVGSLEGWVRVAAVRVALNLIESWRREPTGEPLDEDLLPAGVNLELDYLRERYRACFGTALRQAVAELAPADRAILRFHFVDGLTPGHIGGIYGVHRTTILRRIDALQDTLLSHTRAHVMRELRLSPSECDSLLDLVRSRLPMTLSSLFRSPTP
jgi:RNA polymerase sigma-70 factor (ECF subfamily)